MMFFTDENHYSRGIWEMAKTNTSKVLRYCEIFLPFQREEYDYAGSAAQEGLHQPHNFQEKISYILM